MIDIADKIAAPVKAVVMVVLGNGTWLQSVKHIITLQKPRHSGYISYNFGPSGYIPVFPGVFDGSVNEIITEFIFSPHPIFQFGPGSGKGGYNTHTGQQHHGDAAAKYNPRRGYILAQVKLLVFRPMKGVTPKPNYHNPFFDFRFQ
jgi:hypothetical protein